MDQGGQGMKDNSFLVLREKIISKKAKIGVIGLGYVGLNLGVVFAKAGFKVQGYDVDVKKIESIKKGESYIIDVSSQDLKELVEKKRFRAFLESDFLKSVDVILICVSTPLSKTRQPDLTNILNAIEMIKKYIHKSILIVLESTVFPGTTQEILLSAFLETGLKIGRDFFLCSSPERIDPGNKKFCLENIPKLIGGVTKKCTLLGKLLYSHIIKEVFPVSNSKTAEMAKLLENTFRAVNIALVNEMAIICKKLDINVWEVIEAASTKPFGFMKFLPGPGIGGECIPVDPLYLVWKAKFEGVQPQLIELASQINFYMPEYVTYRILETLNLNSKPIKSSRILILGIAYKKDTKDIKESPALTIIKNLLNLKAKVGFSDPFVRSIRIENKMLFSKKITPQLLKEQDLVVIITDHSKFDYEFIFKNSNLIFDCRGVYKFRQNRKVVKL